MEVLAAWIGVGVALVGVIVAAWQLMITLPSRDRLKVSVIGRTRLGIVVELAVQARDTGAPMMAYVTATPKARILIETPVRTLSEVLLTSFEVPDEQPHFRLAVPLRADGKTPPTYTGQFIVSQTRATLKIEVQDRARFRRILRVHREIARELWCR